MLSGKADASGKFLAEIKLDNKQNKLKAGMLTDVTSHQEHLKQVCRCPSAQLSAAQSRQKVLCRWNNSSQKIIKTGMLLPEKIQVTEGLQQATSL
jgi:hypothetical protein